ncbi:MAG: UxaA family hydrolase [Candidatus Methanomethylicia archaeon]
MKAIKMNPKDNVATAIENIGLGSIVVIISADGEVVDRVEAKREVPFGHKIAITNIKSGENIVKYGETIGRAIRDIERGEYVHIHNIESLRMPLPQYLRREMGK